MGTRPTSLHVAWIGGSCPNHIPWIWGVFAAIVSGLAMAACLAPLHWHWLAWVALVPFLLVLPRMSADQVWLCGMVLGLAYYGVALAWLYQLSHLFGAIFLFEFAVLLGLAFRVARLLMERFGTAAMVWAVPLMFVGQEVLRSEGLPRLRFAFGAWGYSQAHNLWAAQIASIGGVYFVSGLLVLVSASLAYGVIVRTWRPAAVSVAAVLAPGVIAQPRDYIAMEHVPVACVQGEYLGYPQYGQLVAEALRAAQQPKFVVMPEHALVDLYPENDPAIEMLAALAKQHGAYVCAAGDTRDPGGPCPFDNVAWLIGPDGRIVARQLKAVPIPLFRDGNPARWQEVAPTPYGRVGMYICYDGTFTDVPRRLVDLGAEVLLAPVMDVEDWPEQQRQQHADLAIFRAIELRRCVVRAASSGISQVIDATGCVTAVRTKEQGPGVLAGSVYFNGERTLFVRGGWVFAPAAGATFLGTVVVLTAASVRKRMVERMRRRRSMTADPMGLVYGNVSV